MSVLMHYCVNQRVLNSVHDLILLAITILFDSIVDKYVLKLYGICFPAFFQYYSRMCGMCIKRRILVFLPFE